MESLIRLASAHAKLRLSRRITLEDAQVAIDLMSRALKVDNNQRNVDDDQDQDDQDDFPPRPPTTLKKKTQIKKETQIEEEDLPPKRDSSRKGGNGSKT